MDCNRACEQVWLRRARHCAQSAVLHSSQLRPRAVPVADIVRARVGYCPRSFPRSALGVDVAPESTSAFRCTGVRPLGVVLHQQAGASSEPPESDSPRASWGAIGPLPRCVAASPQCVQRDRKPPVEGRIHPAPRRPLPEIQVSPASCARQANAGQRTPEPRSPLSAGDAEHKCPSQRGHLRGVRMPPSAPAWTRRTRRR